MPLGSRLQSTKAGKVIPIDPIYGETVNLEDYQVFLTPVGAWADLYVLDQGRASFTVARAQDGPDVAFHYRIVARRRGYEGVRLEVNDRADRVTAP